MPNMPAHRTLRPTLLFGLALPALLALSTPLAAEVGQGTGTSWALKMFETTSHDFGHVASGSDVRFNFEFKNIYQQTVHISNVRSSCGCATPQATKLSVESGETAAISVRIDTVRHQHQKNPNITVTFDAPSPGEVTLPVAGYIRTDVVLKPGAVNFGVVDRGLGASQTVAINYAGRSDWNIEDVRSRNDHLTASLKEVKRQNGLVDYELTVKLKPDTPPGTLRDAITLVTDDANSPYVPVLVEGKIEADISVTPSPLSLGRLAPGQKRTVNLVVRGKKPFAIDKVVCGKEGREMDVRLIPAPRPVHVLPLTVDCPSEAGDFTEEIQIMIAGRDEPVTVKAYGQIVGQE